MGIQSLARTVVVSFCEGDADLDPVQHLIGGRALQCMGLVCHEAQGRYKGQAEASWVVEVRSPQDVAVVCAAAARYNQESILVVDQDNTAKLVYAGLTPRVVKLGRVFRADVDDGRDCTIVGDHLFVVIPCEEVCDEPVSA